MFDLSWCWCCCCCFLFFFHFIRFVPLIECHCIEMHRKSHVYTGPTYCSMSFSSYVYGLGLVFILNDRCILFVVSCIYISITFSFFFYSNVLSTYGILFIAVSYFVYSLFSLVLFFFFFVNFQCKHTKNIPSDPSNAFNVYNSH